MERRRAFEALVREALDLLPPEFLPYLENVEILVEEEASCEVLDALGVPEDGDLYGLYTGTPLPERGHDPPGFPDRITLFRRPLAEDFPDPDRLREEVARTVIHEVAHHFGIGEARLEELGWG